MYTKASVTLLFLSLLTLFTLTDCSTCEINVLEGESLRLKLTDRTLKDDDRFVIIKNNTVVVPKRNKNQKGPGIVKNNYLELVENVNQNYFGTYTVEVFSATGNKINSYSKKVCVFEKVPKPRVNITCEEKEKKTEKVKLRCDVEGKNLTYSWKKNGKEIKNAASKELSDIDPDNSVYTCTAQNPVHSNISDAVEAVCSSKLFGFDFWVMVSILAGGGSLVLLLMIVLMSLACRSCRRREKHQRDEEEFRLNNFHSSETNGQQKSKQTARGQPAPPEPYDNVTAHEVPCETESKPRTQQRARPPPPPIEDEEEQPPPLPQPRTNPRTKKRERPV